MTPLEWKKIQKRLMHLGFNPGPIDGIRGRNTTNAVRAFQASRGLVVDGIVGPLTHEELFGESDGAEIPSFDTMPWFDEANHLIGLKEVVGPGSNPQILDMAEELDINYGDDDIPWCGLFVAHCIGSTLAMEPLPTNPLGARQWAKFGEDCSPQLGAVLVFWRGSKNGWKGHVGFYAGEDSSAYHVLGGNQSNEVNIRRITKKRFLAARWPLTGPGQSNTVLVGSGKVADSDGNEE